MYVWSTLEMEKEWGAAKYFKYHQKLKDAWDETEGKVLTYEEKLAQTPFCRLTNGSTRDGKAAGCQPVCIPKFLPAHRFLPHPDALHITGRITLCYFRI